MPLTAPPTIPLITDPSTFAVRAQDWVVWQAEQLYPFISETSTLLGLSTNATSVTSNSIGTGAKTFTVEAGKGFIAGQSLSIAYTTTPTNRMFAVVTSYDSGTGALVVNVQAVEGSGTYTAWSLALAFNGTIDSSQIEDDAVITSKIPNDAVTYAKLQNVSATSKVLGRKTAAAGDVEECSLSELLDFIGSAAQGDILYRGGSAWARLPAGIGGQYLKTLGAGANPEWADISQGLTLATAQATTSGTTKDFVIPSGVKLININFDQVSSNVNGYVLGIRIGTGGVPATTNYNSTNVLIGSAANTTLSASSTGSASFLAPAMAQAANNLTGTVTLSLIDPSTNTWIASGNLGGNGGTIVITGSRALSGELNIVRIYNSTFDNGQVNVAYL